MAASGSKRDEIFAGDKSVYYLILSVCVRMILVQTKTSRQCVDFDSKSISWQKKFVYNHILAKKSLFITDKLTLKDFNHTFQKFFYRFFSFKYFLTIKNLQSEKT